MAAKELIQTITVGAGGAANIEFTSIPQTYTDLHLVLSLRASKADKVSEGLIRINGSTSDLSNRSLIGDNSAAYTAGYVTSRIIGSANGNTATSNTFSSHVVTFPNYTSSANKSFSADAVSEDNGGYTERGIHANLWAQTAAITSLSIYSSVNWLQYSSASLYGINKGSGGATVA